MRRMTGIAALWAVCAAMGNPSPASACSVPVYRYALERWPAGLFTVSIAHAGDFTKDERAIVDALREAASRGAVNGTFVDVPTNESPATLVVEFPEDDGLTNLAWKGPFTAETARQLLDSPVRRELVRRLVQGDSMVWMLLDGDPASATLLRTQLRALEQEIKPPEVDPGDPRTADNESLKTSFSILPVSRTDPAERVFVGLLLNTSPRLADTNGPIAFPVFGRGRVLAGFAGETLNAAGIAEACTYVCGACSCEIKSQNPGVDLLIAANWDDSIAECVVKDPALPPLVSLSSLAAAAQPAPLAPVPVVPTARLRRNLLIASACVLAVALAGTLIALRRKLS